MKVLENLSRIAGKLVEGIKRLHTFVGKIPNFYAFKDTAVSEKKELDIKIDDKTETVITSLTENIKDDEVREGIAKFLRLSAFLQEKDLKNGAIPCRICSVPAFETDICSSCRREIDDKIKNIIISSLNNEPWKNFEDICLSLEAQKLPKISFGYYRKIKSMLISAMRSSIWTEINKLEEGTPLPDSLSGTMVELASMVSEVKVWELDEKIAVSALKPRLAQIYLSGKVRHYGSAANNNSPKSQPVGNNN